MKRMAEANGPNFDNFETYSYFCVEVLPAVFRKLRDEGRLTVGKATIKG